jgi:hypothetical protein
MLLDLERGVEQLYARTKVIQDEGTAQVVRDAMPALSRSSNSFGL